ncbi:MAG: alpha/beta fold hydrolase [Pseudomonadota bacterium]
MEDLFIRFLSLDWSGLMLAACAIGAGLILASLGRGRWRIPAYALIAIGVILGGGATSHLYRVQELKQRFPAPGRFVDADGISIHILAEGDGDGTPSIVWFPGGHAPSIGFIDVHEVVKTTHRSILIDRPSTGWSGTGQFPLTTEDEAHQMMAALKAAGEEGPFLFAGHSFGGLLAANIARRYPDETAGVVLLDATPLDVIVYGADTEGLANFRKRALYSGILRPFGFYRNPLPPEPEGLEDVDPAFRSWLRTATAFQTRSRELLAAASIFEELTTIGLADRGFQTHIFDGDLDGIPVWVVTPLDDPGMDGYIASVTASSEEEARFTRFLADTREAYMRSSDRSVRVIAPEGTTHNFVYEAPEFLTDLITDIADELAVEVEFDQKAAALDPEAIKRMIDWPGPYGGVPPVDEATPALMEAAFLMALKEHRTAVASIAASSEPPTFENTILALEESRVPLSRIEALLGIFMNTKSSPEVAAVAGAVMPQSAVLADEIAHNTALFQRVEAVVSGATEADLSPADARLTTFVYEDFLRRGARLEETQKEELRALSERLAALRGQFVQNVMSAEGSLVYFVGRASDLEGLTDAQLTAAKIAAETQGRPEEWAIPINRAAVWPVFTHVHNRDVRAAVYDLWINRAGTDGKYDNRPITADIVKLRGEKARLLGYPTFAHYQTSSRMAGTPETALDLMMTGWDAVRRDATEEIASLQALVDAEGGDFVIEPWDRLYYRERIKAERFDFEVRSVEPYLTYDGVKAAMFYSAEIALGLTFEPAEGVPTVDPLIEVFEVHRGDDLVGILYMDLFQRPAKGPSSWASQYRPATTYQGQSLPLVVFHSAIAQQPGEGPVTMPWERANVIFHEFGHTLHTLSSTAVYPSLNPLALPWDFIEVPALFHEIWFRDRQLGQEFLRHAQTGEPMPESLVDSMEQALAFDRVFSVQPDYLAMAILDLRLHLLADGRDLSPIDVQAEVLEDIGMPKGADVLLSIPHAFHTFNEQYAAGVYTYYWSDVIAADVAEAFLDTPQGLRNEELWARYESTMLETAAMGDPADAFQEFRGREPDASALLRRFELIN